MEKLGNNKAKHSKVKSSVAKAHSNQKIKRFSGLLTKAPSSSPKVYYAEIRYARGYEYFNLHKWNNALRDFLEVARLTPRRRDAHCCAGVAYLILKKYRKAIVEFSKEITLRPGDWHAYNNRANAYNKIGRHDLALKDCESALKRGAEERFVRYNRDLARKFGEIEE
ncbi:Tetratricopeptide repeat protein [Candidatus Gugararchaeum adminiculabundum]|nr:Tetratricopeptide repeat protein [Candidatus Gugararchaeum adminiculabundum]